MTQTHTILLIYTGGTIGMQENPETGALAPFNFEAIANEVPEVGKFNFSIEAESMLPLLDSSDATPEFWTRLAQRLLAQHHRYDGFVVLHGTDTMCYTAAALSLMLPNFNKPIVLTGSQLPIGAIRTDGKENLLGAIEVAAQRVLGKPVVPEVSIFFNHKLMRGNRTSKFGAARFDAFRSFNYPYLAEAGIHIWYNQPCIRIPKGNPQTLYCHFSSRVMSIRLFPGLALDYLQRVLEAPTLQGLVLETYGAGNGPSNERFSALLKHFIDRGGIVLNVTQCPADSVEMETYDVGLKLKKIGVVSGRDLTFECAIVKLMLALGEFNQRDQVIAFLQSAIAGEMNA